MQNKGAHENFAQFRIPGDQHPQVPGAEFKKLAGLSHAPDHQTTLAGDHGHLAGELSRFVQRDHPFAIKGRLHDFHAAREQDIERNRRVARLEQDVAAPHLAQAPQGANTVDLFSGECRKSPGECVSRTNEVYHISILRHLVPLQTRSRARTQKIADPKED